jgi:hypothetical protein
VSNNSTGVKNACEVSTYGRRHISKENRSNGISGLLSGVVGEDNGGDVLVLDLGQIDAGKVSKGVKG